MINLHPDSRPPHARQFSFECTENRHWMEIMKALVQGSGKEYKFGNARWGKEGGGKPRAAHFSHTVSVGVTQSWGRKLRLRVELVCLPKELEICSRAQEKNSALLQFGVLFCQKTTSESKSNTSCKLVFLASCWAWEESPFSKESNKKKKNSFQSYFYSNVGRGETVSVAESLTTSWFKMLNHPETTDNPNSGTQSCLL